MISQSLCHLIWMYPNYITLLVLKVLGKSMSASPETKRHNRVLDYGKLFLNYLSPYLPLGKIIVENMYVVVNFLSQVIFVFLLFLRMVM